MPNVLRAPRRFFVLILVAIGTLVHGRLAAADDDDAPKLSPPLARLDGASGVAIVFSADGARILTAGDHEARLWEGQTYKPVIKPLKHAHLVRAAVLTRDGKRIATAAGNEAIVWDAETGRKLFALPHAKPVLDVEFSPDDKLLATACLDKSARTWDAETAARVGTFEQIDPVRCVTFSPDGSLLAVSTQQQPLNVATPRAGEPPIGEFGFPEKPAFVDRPDIRSLTMEAGGSVHVWRLSNRAHRWRFDEESHLRLAVGKPAFTPDGKWIAIGADIGVYICDAESGTVRAEWRRDWGRPLLQFSADGRRLLASGMDISDDPAALRVFQFAPADRSFAQRLTSVCAHARDQVYSAAISPDGKTFACPDGLWRITDPNELPRLLDHGSPHGRHEEWQRCVRFDHDGERVAAGYANELGTRSFTLIWAVPKP